MKSILDAKTSGDKYFTQAEKDKVLSDMWNKDGMFYKFLKDKIRHKKALHIEIDDYINNQCLNDDRCAAEFADYIADVIGRRNFSVKQVRKFINTEDIVG